jgi:hypothetical protein
MMATTTYPELKCKEGVLASLTILGDTTLELTGASRDEDGAVSQGGAGYHVFDKFRVSRRIDDLRLERSATFSRLGIGEKPGNKGLIVTTDLGVSHLRSAISMMIFRSPSAFSVSNTRAVGCDRDNRRVNSTRL